MNGQTIVYDTLEKLNIKFDYYEHPAVPTIDDAKKYWADISAQHCKNIFLRNHKGNRHYLVIIDYRVEVNIHNLESNLKQGKLSFASEHRMMKYLRITAGSVSPFGLLNDETNHVHLFIDESLRKAEKISFHPNLNTASVVISFTDFIRYLNYTGNSYEFILLHD
jgi:Ala-tRNA(Pro) deacylase